MVDPNHPHWRISKLRLLKEYARAIWDGREAKQKGRVNPIEARFDCPSGGFGQVGLTPFIFCWRAAKKLLVFHLMYRSGRPAVFPDWFRSRLFLHFLLLKEFKVKKYHIGREMGYLGEIDKLTWTEIDGHGDTGACPLSSITTLFIPDDMMALQSLTMEASSFCDMDP
ncbi:hypothetical protein C8J56DRAFT_897823 [Mycena floridula]|nr:hypothetical protein C8J56DRAFT_897823 [Mycena floridula]